jgi:hypothetical protein
MAIMARSLDIPARVAVGFTPGTFSNEGRWVVRAHNYHAWPELYFDGLGWIRFEPTPSVAVAPDWTVPPSAADAPSNSGNPAPVPAPSDSAGAEALRDDQAGAGGGSSGGGGSSVVSTILVVALATALMISLPRGLARAGERLRRRRAGDDPRSRAEAAWADLRGASRELGLPWDDAATPRRIGAALASDAGLDGGDREALDRVVTILERARYSRSSAPAASLDADVATVRTALARQASRLQRVRAYLWPATIGDALAATSGRISDAFDRLDALSERLRASWARAVRADK